ncbi:MAG: hypothetical protein COA47_16440 [Robiginitomaculum sp.]|nr:MAG: hypothetical protein COA47_16440 [Robiginitomaculum sp.]
MAGFWTKSAKRSKGLRGVFIGLSLLMLAGCETLDSNGNAIQGTTLAENLLVNQVERAPRGEQADTATIDGGEDQIVDTPSQIGRIPVLSVVSKASGPSKNTTPPSLKAERVDAFVAPLILPEFIDVVFGEMLQTPYITGPEVAARTDVVQLRSSGEMASGDFLSLISSALEEYGVRVVAEDGAWRLLEDKALRARMPRFIKSRARLRTRSDLRPVVQFVELQAIEANAMLIFLRQTFGSKSDKIKIEADPGNNYIVLSGLPEDVDAAIAIIQELDELRFAGSQVQRYTPKYWDVDELAESLVQAMRVEGWQITMSVNSSRIIYVMPVTYSNDLFVFTKSKQALKRVNRWLTEFDRPINGGDTIQIYIYQVKNVDASLLAESANAAIRAQKGQVSLAARESDLGGNPSAVTSPNLSRAGAGGMFSVDPLGNRIIFSGTNNDFDKMIRLLEQLDTPTPEVLIEVLIAEVTLSDNTNFGLDFLVNNVGGGTSTSTIRTGGLGLGSSGLTVGILSGDVEATINAFATNRQVKLLSRPVLTARSGGTAEFQVGQDVPIITSQRAANNQAGGGTTDILQNVAYRKTGVLLSIEPIVFSDNRIDLSIVQEVSSTIDTPSAATSSPTISNRSISTQLSLEDGATAILAGLIQETVIRDDKGIPILKDIPIIGQAFSNDSVSLDRTELVILITAYVLRGQADKTQFVNQLSRRIDNSLANEDRLVTLLPKQF